MLTGTVQRSAKYISNGSLILEPISKATFDDVGVKITSYFSKFLANSFFTKVRTCCAFL